MPPTAERIALSISVFVVYSIVEGMMATGFICLLGSAARAVREDRAAAGDRPQRGLEAVPSVVS